MASHTLLDRHASGNCWRVRLLAGFAGLTLHRIEIDIMAGAQHAQDFVSLNPRRQVPVLVEETPGDTEPIVIWDSCAILVYLAATHAEQFLAKDALRQARQQQWLAVAGQEHQTGIRTARGAVRFGLPIGEPDLLTAQAIGRRSLEMMDRRLSDSAWLAGSLPNVCDIACFPYAALASEGGISKEGLPALDAWLAAMRSLPGFVELED